MPENFHAIKTNKSTKDVNKNTDVSQHNQAVNIVEEVLLMCYQKKYTILKTDSTGQGIEAALLEQKLIGSKTFLKQLCGQAYNPFPQV